jgi:hypothetical protein
VEAQPEPTAVLEVTSEILFDISPLFLSVNFLSSFNFPSVHFLHFLHILFEPLFAKQKKVHGTDWSLGRATLTVTFHHFPHSESAETNHN